MRDQQTTSELQSIVRFKFHDGKLERFRELRANLAGGPVQVVLPYMAP